MPTDYLILRRAARLVTCTECGRSLVDDAGTCPHDHYPRARSEEDLRRVIDLATGGADHALAEAQADLRRSAITDLGPTPDPVPGPWLRELIELAGVTQGEAARLIHVEATTLRKWLAPETAASHRGCPWAAAELLRRILLRH